jgi:hypothetical protein
LISAVYHSAYKKVIVAYRRNNTDYYGVVQIYIPSSLTTNKNTFIGISQASAINGAAVRVKVKGSLDSNQSGLTAGQTYYVSTTGTLTTTSTDNFLAGKAVSATKLLISNWSQ